MNSWLCTCCSPNGAAMLLTCAAIFFTSCAFFSVIPNLPMEEARYAPMSAVSTSPSGNFNCFALQRNSFNLARTRRRQFKKAQLRKICSGQNWT